MSRSNLCFFVILMKNIILKDIKMLKMSQKRISYKMLTDLVIFPIYKQSRKMILIKKKQTLKSFMVNTLHTITRTSFLSINFIYYK